MATTRSRCRLRRARTLFGLVAAATAAAVGLPAGQAGAAGQPALAVLAPVLVSTTADGVPGDGASTYPLVSDDGSKVLFDSLAQNFVNAPPPGGGVYQKRGIDRIPGRIRLFSRNGSNHSGGPFQLQDASPTGGAALYAARGAVSPADTNGTWALYFGTLLVSRTGTGAAPDGPTQEGQLGGGLAAVASRASDLVPGDTNARSDVFALALTGDPGTVRVSVRPDGSQSAGTATRPRISRDGRFVAFLSTATDLVPGLDTDGGLRDAFVRDLQTGTTTWVSLEAPAGTDVTDVALSPDGSRVLQRWQSGQQVSVRLKDLGLGTGTGTGTSVLVPAAAGFGPRPFSTDNRLVGYVDAAGRALVRDLVAGTVRPLAAKAGTPDGVDGPPTLTPSGRYAVFSSTSTLVGLPLPAGVAQIYRVPVRLS